MTGPSPSRSPVATAPPTDLMRGKLRGRGFRAVRRVLWLVLGPALRMRVDGLERVPATGPLLVVCNHLHNADPVIVSVAFPRPLHFMAKKELFGVPVIGWLIRKVGAFPVDRGTADRAAIRHAEAALRQGIAVGMFPEGTRSLTGALQRAHPGVGLLALRSGAPVLPMVVTGSERLPLNGAKGRRPTAGRREVLVQFGDTFAIPRELDGHRVTADQATDMMMAAVARMLPEQYRGVYADSVAGDVKPTPRAQSRRDFVG